ncbi:hypothetical protein NDU88_004312 [Pleurodeles waltl]|uniref:Uncharacterized protein n=1 Tax=Pleurodeles waltl TaxID=8319 RepID=A0AAV7RIS9_PLEWA|nr:hypothetical protein NDU88_004312 [Pleurodeles waltl]
MSRVLCVDSSACFLAARRSGRLCVEFSFSRQASRRFPLWKSGGVVLARPCDNVPVAPKVSRRSASVCGDFLAAEQAVRRNFQHTKSPNEKEKSFSGPETSGNRRQALSKPLENTSAARQEFSKAAGQQQGSSPL